MSEDQQRIQELITEWEAGGGQQTLQRLVERGRSSPEPLLSLAHRNRELHQINQENRELLSAAKEALEERENGVRYVAAYIREGPRLPDGAPTAIVDRGGQRQVVAMLDGVTPEECRARSTVLVNQDGSLIVGTLEEYEPPAEITRVLEVVDESRVLVESRAEEQMILEVRHDLRGLFREGDRALVDRRHNLVVGRRDAVEKPAEWMLEQMPPERFADVAAQEEAIRHIIERAFWPLQHPHLIERMGLPRAASLLLYGRSGCGKTLLGKAVAGELQERLGGREYVFLRIKAGSLKSKWYGETTARIQRLWRYARSEAKQGKVVVIFLDECDSLGKQRGGYGHDYGHGADLDATNAWLSEMDGIDTDRSQQILVIASTNFESHLDPAFIGRFSLALPIRRPDADGARQIFRVHLNHGLPMERSADEMIDRAVRFLFDDEGNALLTAHLHDGKQTETIRRSHLLTGRLVRDCVERAKWRVVRDVLENGEEALLRPHHILGALDEQFSELARKMTSQNIREYVDLPAVRDGQVTRVVPVAFSAAEWQYIA